MNDSVGLWVALTGGVMSFLSPLLEESKFRPSRASAPAAVGFLALCLALALAMVGAWAGAAADSAQAGHAGAGPVGDDTD